MGRSFNLHRRGVHVHALQQLPQHRAELHRAGQARILRGPRCSRTRSRSSSCCFSSANGSRCSRSSAAARNGCSGVKTLTRYIGRELLAAILLIFSALVMLFAFFDLIHELGDVGRGGYTLSARAALRRAAAAVADVRALSRRGADRHAVRDGAARREFRVHGDARVGRVAAAGHMGAVRIGIPLAIATFLAGEFVAPPAERLAQQIRAPARGGEARIVAQQFQSGFWFKQDLTFVNIRSVLADMTLSGVRIYEFDSDLRLKTVRTAESGSVHRQRSMAARQGAHDAICRSKARDARGRGPLGVGHGAAALAPHRLPGCAGAARAQHALGQHPRAAGARRRRASRSRSGTRCSTRRPSS